MHTIQWECPEMIGSDDEADVVGLTGMKLGMIKPNYDMRVLE
jgi:hypothetical protein